MSLNNDLKNFIEMMAKVHACQRPGWVYPSPYHFLLEHGEFFGSQILPQDSMEVLKRAVGKRSLPVRHCFENAAQVVLNDTSGRLTYCEGFAVRIVPTHHAWIIVDDVFLADVTWNRMNKPTMSSKLSSKILGVWYSEDVAYFGVKFSKERLSRQLLETEVYSSLLLDMERDFPLMKEKFDAAKEIEPDWVDLPEGGSIPMPSFANDGRKFKGGRIERQGADKAFQKKCEIADRQEEDGR